MNDKNIIATFEGEDHMFGPYYGRIDAAQTFGSILITLEIKFEKLFYIDGRLMRVDLFSNKTAQDKSGFSVNIRDAKTGYGQAWPSSEEGLRNNFITFGEEIWKEQLPHVRGNYFYLIWKGLRELYREEERLVRALKDVGYTDSDIKLARALA